MLQVNGAFQQGSTVPLNHALDVRQLRLLRLFSLQLRKSVTVKRIQGAAAAS